MSAVGSVAAADGTSILTRHWEVAGGGAWARLLIVHGIAEHSGRYEHVGEALASAGIDTHAFDLRGFGRSGGRRAFVDRWSQFHDDLAERLEPLHAASPRLPLVLYGHSLGGLIALGYVLDPRPAPDLLVVSAPAIAATVPRWKRVIAEVLGRVAPRMTVANDLDAALLSRDPEVGADYGRDPLNVHRSTVALGRAAFGEQRRVATRLGRLDVPALVLHGGADTLVPTATSEVLAHRPNVTRHVYRGLRHEVHNEPERGEVLADVITWIRDNAREVA